MSKRLHWMVLLSVILLLLAPTSALAQFRGIEWGTSKDEVLLRETSARLLLNQGSTLVYADTVLGMDVHLMYQFNPKTKELAAAGYVFNTTHSNDNEYIDDYDKIRESLTAKYGRPISDETIWHNNLYRNRVQQWGFAVSVGHLEYVARWSDGDTDISLKLDGDNFDITLILLYTSRDLFVQMMNASDEAERDKL